MSKQAPRTSSSGVVPWPAETAAGYLAKGYWEGRSLASHIVDAARKTPDAVCLVDGAMRITYRELLSRSDAAAVRMRELGLRADDRIIIQLPNCWEFVVTTLACLRLGAIPVWAMPQYRMNELFGLTAHSEARALVVPDVYKGFDHQALAHEVAAALPAVEYVVVAGGSNLGSRDVDLGELIAPASDPDQVSAELDATAPDGDAVATFLLSGGTTAAPKLIPRTNNDLSYMIKRAAELCGFDRATRYLAALPLGHGFANTGPGVLGTLLSGGRVVIIGSPAPEVAFNAIEDEYVTATSVVPAIVGRWLDYRADHPDTDVRSLRLIQVAAARLDPALAERIGPELGCTLQQVFGMGEGLLCMTRLDDSPEVAHRTQGRPISPDDEVRIVDDEGNPVPDGEQGVLLARGPYTVRGYYNSQELNARVFTGDGWYNTGDVVRRTPDGNIVVVGREKDVINRGGEKISAEEVEAFACMIDGISQAAAVPMPHPELGEVVCLYVVVADQAAVDIDDVRTAMMAAGAATFKLPERLITVESLPETGVGKIDKKALRARLWP
jgi:2,3-dihydroxybenzoate-AMP ligase